MQRAKTIVASFTIMTIVLCFALNTLPETRAADSPEKSQRELLAQLRARMAFASMVSKLRRSFQARANIKFAKTDLTEEEMLFIERVSQRFAREFVLVGTEEEPPAFDISKPSAQQQIVKQEFIDTLALLSDAEQRKQLAENGHSAAKTNGNDKATLSSVVSGKTQKKTGQGTRVFDYQIAGDGKRVLIEAANGQGWGLLDKPAVTCMLFLLSTETGKLHRYLLPNDQKGPTGGLAAPTFKSYYYGDTTSSFLSELHSTYRFDFATNTLNKIDKNDSFRDASLSPNGNFIVYRDTHADYLAGELRIRETTDNTTRPIAKGLTSPVVWRSNGKHFLAARSKIGIVSVNLATGDEKVVHPVPEHGDTLTISGIMISPNGYEIGYYVNATSTYHSVNLKTKAVSKLFTRDYLGDDGGWNESGICFQDKVQGQAATYQIKFWDAQTKRVTVVATGDYRNPKWLNANEIIVENDGKLCSIDIRDKSNRQVFPLAD